MTSTISTAKGRELRRSAFDRATAMRLAATEYTRCAEACEQIGPEQWGNPTDCTEWDVRALAGHILGMAEMAASIREESRQRRLATTVGGEYIDALTALQVREHADLTPAELIGRLHRVGPKAVRGRRRAPGFIRRRSMPMPGMEVDGRPEWWALGYLLDTVLTRDPWMHRVDLSRAIDRPMHLTPDHDGVLVADVVTEWAGRHGRPYRLHLSGPAGGTWSHGTAGVELELDAIEFCRALSGRVNLPGLLATVVPF